MKKKCSILLIMLLMTVFTNSCNFNAGANGASSSIEDSIQKGVFICEYIALPNPYPINDTLSLFVKFAWLEERWKYTKSFSTVSKSGEYQLIIISNVDLYKKGYAQSWKIGNIEIKQDREKRRELRLGNNESLITDFVLLPTDKKESWTVHAGDILDRTSSNIPIGEFSLVKKE